jgi:hypothetical protein
MIFSRYPVAFRGPVDEPVAETENDERHREERHRSALYWTFSIFSARNSGSHFPKASPVLDLPLRTIVRLA